MTQVLGKKGRKKWQHSLPEQHVTRQRIIDVYEELHNGNIYLYSGDDSFWEHVNGCKHCFLIREDVERKATIEMKEKMSDVDRDRELSLDPYYPGCGE